MRRRDLCRLADDTVVGAVVLDGRTARFEGVAVDVFARMREKAGDTTVARRLIEDGWSNGYTLYLADPVDESGEDT